MGITVRWLTHSTIANELRLCTTTRSSGLRCFKIVTDMRRWNAIAVPDMCSRPMLIFSTAVLR